MRRLVRSALLGAVLLAATAGLAAPPGKQAADALFRDGRAAFDAGDYPTACAKFEASWKLDAALGTQLNLAVCEDKIGKLTSARKRVADLIPRLPPKDDRLPFAKKLAAELDARIPTLALARAADAPADTVVRLGEGGAPLPLGEPIPLDPGLYDLLITAPGRPPATLQLRLSVGQREQRVVAPGAPPATTDPGAESREKGRRARQTAGFVAGGVGVAGLGLAAVTGVVLLSKKSEIDERCPNQRCDAAGLALVEEGRSTPLLPLNTVGWIVAIAGIGAGATLVLTSRPSGSTQSARLAPYASPSSGGLAVSGRF